jgi:hypothetical protein
MQKARAAFGMAVIAMSSVLLAANSIRSYTGSGSLIVSIPLSMPDKMADVFNPVSDSVVIRIHDYDNTEQDATPMFSIKP